MLISKNGKKLMAFVMSLAMLLTGLLYVPKPAEAAENDNVEVLGATLRFSDADVDNNGRQSMRLGIAVPNASKTKSCQITVTVNGVSKVISTEPAETEGVDLQHNKILSYDKDTDTAIYAIVIKGISKDNFYTNIEMTGQSTDLEGETTHTSKKESRNVMGVVKALQAKYPDLKIDIDENGNLYTNKDKNDKLVLEDLKDYDDTKPAIYENEELDLSSAIEEGKVEKASDGKGIYIKDLGTGYKSIKLGHKVNEGGVIGVKIEGNLGENSDGVRCYPSTIDDSNSADANLLRIEGKGDFSEYAEFTIGEGDKNYAEYLCIKGKPYQAQLKDVTIRSITVTYKLNSDPAPTDPGASQHMLDLNTFTVKNGVSTVEDDGSLTIVYKANYTGSSITIPEDIDTSIFSYAEVEVMSYKDGKEDGGNQVIFRDKEGKEITTVYGNGVKSCMVPQDKQLGSIMIQSQNASEETPQTMKIKYIKLCKVVNLDLSKFNARGAEESKLNEDGSLSVTYKNSSRYTGSSINLADYSDCTYFEVSYAKTPESAGVQVVLNFDDKSKATEYSWRNPIPFNVPDGKKPTELVINNQGTDTEEVETITQTIYYIKGVCK